MHKEEIALAADRGLSGGCESTKTTRFGACELLKAKGVSGRHLTLRFPSVFSMTKEEEAAVCKTLSNLFLQESARLIGEVKSETRVLFVGLGNRDATADALGPLAAERIRPTAQLSEKLRAKLCVPALSVFCPKVAAQTGIESAQLVRAATEAVRPSLVIAADATATASAARLGCTVGITDVGIRPGGGVGNGGVLLSREFLGVPILSVGFPTVLDASELPIAKGEDFVFDYLLPRDGDAACARMAAILARAVECAFGIPTLL